VNCILYVFDSLRFDHVGTYGYEEDVTPNVDAVAKDGVYFQRAYAQGTWTLPSSASVFTGLYPEAHGSSQLKEPLPGGVPHLADQLDDVTTACFSTNPIVSTERGFGRGFDEFYDIDKPLQPDVMDELNDRLLPWIRKHADEQFFVVVWAMGTHQPYDAPTDSTSEFPEVGPTEWKAPTLRRLKRSDRDIVRTKYDEVVSYSDDRFGDLVEALQTEGVYCDTTMIVTSDHGNIFDKHARFEHAAPLIRKPLKYVLPDRIKRYYGLFEPSAWVGHQAIFPYDPSIHVPLVVKQADGMDRPTGYDERYDGSVELVDVAPTVVDLFDEERDARMQGNSLFEYLADDIDGKEYTFSHSSVVNGNVVFKSVQKADVKFLSVELDTPSLKELTDPRTLQSVADYLVNGTDFLVELPEDSTVLESPGLLKELSGEYREHQKRCQKLNDEIGAEEVALSEDTRDQLEGLGYL